MNTFLIEEAQYYKSTDALGNLLAENAGILAVIDGITMSVPLDEANRHYAEILRQVAAGTLVIQDAE
jgi:hypothetical protein